MISRSDVSVVITSAHGSTELARCLSSVRAQAVGANAELVIVLRPDEVPPEVTGPRERLVRPSESLSLPQRRGAGLKEASGDWVALTETPCVPDRDWLERLLSGASSGDAVLGGSVGNARLTRLIDRGAFFSEYGIYGASHRVHQPDGTPHIAAANLAYHRCIIPEVVAACARGDSEPAIHAHLAATGCTLHLVPNARVRFDAAVSFLDFCADRFAHGRDYAAARNRDLGLVHRAVRALSVPVVVPVLARRIARGAEAEARADFVRSLPSTLVFLSAWACGEAVGYLAGPRAR